MEHKNLFNALKETEPEWANRVYSNQVIASIRGKKSKGGMNVDDNYELALLRKEVARLMMMVMAHFPEYQPSEEFVQYNEAIEKRKADIKANLETTT
jgi:hypothetical protein